MRHIDLFSGIGGFTLAAREVWGDSHEVVTFCEINKYAQQVLKKHWPNAPICDDIRKLNYEFIANANNIRFQEGKEQPSKWDREQYTIATNSKSARTWENERRIRGVFNGYSDGTEIDLLTGGFPCQPFSNAGKKRGEHDDRFLWPEMLRVIKEFKPRWIVGENVAGLIGMAQQQGDAEVGGETDTESSDYDQSEAGGLLFGIIDDIEQAGYTVQAFVIPACAVNAPHRRDRIWIVAHSGCELREQRNGKGMEACSSKRPTGTVYAERCGEDDRYSNINNVQGEREQRYCTEQIRLYNRENTGWDQNWIEVATKFCRMDDGLPVELDGFKLSKSQHRVERLKALGNAIVPQVVMEIFKAIKEVDNETRQRCDGKRLTVGGLITGG